MRKHLLQDFTQVYHLDLHGNVRKNPKLSGTTHNVFGIQVGVGITIAARISQSQEREIHYYRVPEYWSKTEKLAFLQQKESIVGIEWLELLPDSRNTWLTEGIQLDFAAYTPLGTKEAKLSQVTNTHTIFRTYTNGVKTNRDNWVYEFDRNILEQRVKRFIETYNNEIDRWKRLGEPEDVDNFVLNDDTKIKWSRDLKSDLKRRRYAQFEQYKVRKSLYRPFTAKCYFFDAILSQDTFLQPKFFPSLDAEKENVIICLSGISSNKPFQCLASNIVPCLDMLEKTQCFPYYTYTEDGSNRRENITDWALAQFRAQYGDGVTKWDIFHYVYAMLHHPAYRERYAENLKRDLPRIPLLSRREAFGACVRVGKALMELHLNYETGKEYRLQWVENKDVPIDWRVEKMKLSAGKDSLRVNEWLTLAGIPQECFGYRLGNRSALEWVIDQYQVSTDARSGIVSDPNREDDEQYIVRLVGKVVTVSVETVKLVGELAREVGQEDWVVEEEAGRGILPH